MRTQTFGVEIEMTGIARKTASEIAAGYFGTSSEHIGGSYDKYGAKDSSGRLWCFASDASIHVERGRKGEGQQVELVTPILRYEDIEVLQELIRKLRKAGAKVNESYGSNMNVAQMRDRCPDCKLLGVSEVEGYGLEFHGSGGAVATIVPKEDGRVPVVLWEISERDERSLDRYEGFPRLYFKKDFRVYLGKRKVKAFAYIMSSGYDRGIPSEYYFNVILEGYTDNGIDTKPLFAALFEARERRGV